MDSGTFRGPLKGAITTLIIVNGIANFIGIRAENAFQEVILQLLW